MTHQPKPSGKRPGPGYRLADDIPWPTLANGEPYVLGKDGGQYRVRLQGAEDEGVVQYVTWCDPEGGHMSERVSVRKATKTLPERRTLKPGDWFATVSWDDPDRPDRPPVKIPVADLLHIPAGT